MTARHVLGASTSAVRLKLATGESLQVNFADQLPLGDIDITLILVKEVPATVVPLLPESSLPPVGTQLQVVGYPITDYTINVPLTTRLGNYLGAPSKPLDQGYSLLYSASTQIGFSGGPILSPSGAVVGIHGRSESWIDANGIHHRTGNALGIPMPSILSRIGATKGSGASGTVDMKKVRDLAAFNSMQIVVSMLQSGNLSSQILDELSRASRGEVPTHCTQAAKAYYYLYYSSLPDPSEAQASLEIRNFRKDVPAQYYGLASLVAKKSLNYSLSLTYDDFAGRAGMNQLSTYTERRLRSEILDYIASCGKPSAH